MSNGHSLARRVVLLLAAAVAVVVVVYTSVVVRAPEPSQAPAWQDPQTGMEFVLVREGTYQMGTPPHEPDREAQEVPHSVRLSRPFYLGRYEVTQAEWTRVMGQNPSFFNECARCPVEQVNWHDVQEFIRRLNDRSRPGFRLPTEAEWEYACRSGHGEAFGRTGSLSSRDANIHGDFPYNAPKGVFRQQTTVIGYFAPNEWGLYDMSGNVWEWVQDEHCPYPEGPITDPIAECGSGHQVIRGGSWLFNGASARCGLRYTHRPEDSGPSIGVRLVHDVW